MRLDESEQAEEADKLLHAALAHTHTHTQMHTHTHCCDIVEGRVLVDSNH